jgi:hypothetical protein
MARAVLSYLGEKVGDADDLADLLGNKGVRVFQLVTQKQQLMKDAWLTAAGHKRPGMNKGLPLEEAKVKEAEIETEIRKLN